MSNADIRGRFVWHELMTTDTKGAAAFYPKVTGWKTQSWDKDPSYTLWAGAKGPFGGLRELPEAARAAGAHWLPYIGTPGVLPTMEAAQRLGGRLLVGATDIPGGGRFAILADPQGAQFAIFRAPATAEGGDSGSMPQEFSWHELATPDPVAALRFYGELFGWAEVHAHDMGPMGVYHTVGLGGVESIGMWKIDPANPMPIRWLSYAQIADVDKSANAAKAAGGKLLHGPVEVPGGTWIAQLTDPQGAAFALHALKRVAVATPAAQPAKAAAPKPQPPTVKAATAATAAAPAAAAKPAAPATVSQAAKTPAASPKAAAIKAPAKKAAKKKAPKKKAAAKKAGAKKSAAKKSSAQKRPLRKSKAAARKTARKAAAKKKAVKKRGKSGKRRARAGSFAVAKRFAAKQAGSLLKRLRGKKHR